MNVFVIGKIIGIALGIEAALMVLPLMFTLYYGEKALPFLIPMAVGAVLCFILTRTGRRDNKLMSKEGFVSTGLTWIVMSLVGMLPFMICGAVTNPFDAFFETVSGFTTTGSSILTDIEALPKGVLVWRSFTHWIGGMGILVFMSAIMHFGNGSQMNLIKAESPGPVVSKLLPKAGDTARILYIIYTGLTLITLGALLILKMPFYDALCITFGAAGTGGFGVLNSSCADYTTAQQVVITVAMMAFGINFSFYFLLLFKKFSQAFHMEEVWLYSGIILTAIALISIDLMVHNGADSPFMTIHNAAFHVGSIMTTTGFAIDDINKWPHLSQGIIVVLMLCGACAGSTGGGFKVSRLLLMFKAFVRDLALQLHPYMIKKVHYEGKVIDEKIIKTTGIYTFIYCIAMIVSVLLIAPEGKDWSTTITSVIATFNNIGPGIGINGTTGNYESFSNFSKLVLSADMLIGRLEIFPILALFRKETWRRF
ncbi:MAG: TrkH family potassium uptake protein [Eubacteriales bacterium]|nr:TrkH family potassium uptake protein [Eubacteriales bacterium]